jgi:DnaJ-class molecular chaperone
MAKAVKCPVCGGKGKIVKETAFTTGGIVENSEVCHGCDGKGWVEVSY